MRHSLAVQVQLPKAKLIETAAELIYQQGWNATGINQILTEANVPKGSFYYYFHSKEDLGVAIVKYRGQKLRETYEQTLLNEQLVGRAALEAFFEWMLAFQRQYDWRLGCPVGSFSNEVAATTEKIAAACREVLGEMITAMAAAVKRGQKDGSIASAQDPEVLGLLIASIMQGGLLMMKTTRQEAPLRVAIDCVGRNLI